MGGVINILTEIPNEEAITLHSNYGTYNTLTPLSVIAIAF